MIIVEGPDGSGKSTLAAKLGKNVLHAGGPITDSEELIERVDRLSKEYKEGDVIDRFPYLSEIVYGQPPVIDSLLLMSMWGAFQEKYNVCLIYCRTDIQTMYESISHEKKDHKPAKYLEEVKQRYLEIVYGYDRLFEMAGVDFLYDWQKDEIPCVE